MNEHLQIRALAQKFKSRKLNEADTRAQVIDTVLHDVLAWPKGSVKREVHIHPGYADYLMQSANGQTILVIEAKKDGIYFEIPKRNGNSQTEVDFISMRTLLTNPEIKAAVTQVRTYCLDIGCNFGCVTNGHEWIIFRAYEPGTDWKGLRAFVIPSLMAIDNAFTRVFNSLSYKCVLYDGSLNALISRTPLENRETYRPGNDIPVYTRTIEANKYVQYLRPIATRFFGQIDVNDTELMEECYVSDSNYESVFRSAKVLLTDSVTPYLEQYGIKDNENDENGGELGDRIGKASVREPRPEVIVLFGGKGIGKSTFLRRLLYVNPPSVIKENSVVAYIDLLNVPEDKHAIEGKIWSDLIECMDIDGILQSDRDQILQLFSDRFEVAQKQDLFGLEIQTVEYNKTLNELVTRWKADLAYVVRRLALHLKQKKKGIVVVVDNTDQYRALQEYCFTHAQQIARLLSCLVIISMREERFYASTIHGVLDAFQNSGFHLSSPSPQNVFLRRIEFVQKLLKDPARRFDIIPHGTSENVVNTIQTLLRNLGTEFQSNASHLSNFLVACAHGNIRLALELFRELLQSRYTNVDEITAQSVWTWQIHQVLKPVMIPSRFFYEESQSHVPNIFQLRSEKKSSHFTAMRLLSALVKNAEIRGVAFYSLPQLFSELSNRFHMEEDQKLAIDMLLKYGLIESNNRMDEYMDTIDSVRTTAYGEYVFNNLASAFTYLDLISTDTAIFDSRVSNELSKLAQIEFEIWERHYSDRNKRIERVDVRIQKSTELIGYLEREEEREAEEYGIPAAERFIPQIRMALEEEFQRVRRSAARQRF